jgi:hypothetical protein
MIVDLKMKLEIDDNSLNELLRISSHHIDYLLNLDEFPEIKSVSNVMLTVHGKEEKDGEE